LNALESRRLDNYFYAEAGFVVLDGSSLGTNAVALANPSAGLNGAALDSYLASYGEDRPYVIIGGSGANATLAGGHRDDLLVAGDDGGSVTGGPGADNSVVYSFAAGELTISDFALDDGDVVDLSRLPAVPGAFAHQYLQVVKIGDVHLVQTDLDGDGVGFTNLAVSLSGLTDEEADLYTLIESGHLLVGSLELEPRITVAASQAQASENGPTEGSFTLTRQGSLAGELTVNVTLSGSAQNGVDYLLASTEVLLPAGVTSVDVPVVPLQDGLIESAESVQLVVGGGAGYRVGTANQAVVTIEDLLMLVEIEAVEPIAVKDTATPGLFLITRRDVINRDVVIRIAIGGTASNGSDYTALSTFVYMGPFQTVAFLQVMPKATAQLAGGLETVSISILADSNYRMVGDESAQVLIIERNDSFADWRAREYPGDTSDAATFAQADSGNTGVSHFDRYAFGLDPHQPDPDALPRLFTQDGTVGVTFRKPVGLTDVQYRVVASGDLMGWAESLVSVVPMAAPGGSSDPARVYYQLEGDGSIGFVVIEAEWMP
jgi:hypothetical protein